MDLLEEFSFDSLLDRFDRIGVAYSGGLDSTVLLHLLTTKINQRQFVFISWMKMLIINQVKVEQENH